MHILLFIFLLLIALVVFGFSILGFILKTIFGLGRGSSSSQSRRTESGRHGSRQSYNPNTRNPEENTEETYSGNVSAGKRHKKIFSEDDGEYVDFEEIKGE